MKFQRRPIHDGEQWGKTKVLKRLQTKYLAYSTFVFCFVKSPFYRFFIIGLNVLNRQYAFDDISCQFYLDTHWWIKLNYFVVTINGFEN